LDTKLGDATKEAKAVVQGDYPFTQDIMFMPHHHDPSKLKE